MRLRVASIFKKVPKYVCFLGRLQNSCKFNEIKGDISMSLNKNVRSRILKGVISSIQHMFMYILEVIETMNVRIEFAEKTPHFCVEIWEF